jgi:hypothetical protein
VAEFLIEYLTADRLGGALTVVVVAAIFAVVKHSERLRPARKTTDG